MLDKHQVIQFLTSLFLDQTPKKKKIWKFYKSVLCCTVNQWQFHCINPKEKTFALDHDSSADNLWKQSCTSECRFPNTLLFPCTFQLRRAKINCYTWYFQDMYIQWWKLSERIHKREHRGAESRTFLCTATSWMYMHKMQWEKIQNKKKYTKQKQKTKTRKKNSSTIHLSWY